ncbi:MAG TPA: hypothetical protein VEJ20_09470 [Candidatus Eremiobacteraceae bacterium]|nr:hypothetical protein [Candidatus Eremiobacteraceae bacterium]
MSTIDRSGSALRLRGLATRIARRPLDAEVSVPPRFLSLLGIGALAVIAQATLLHFVSFRGAHVSLVTVLLVWTGLRCGVVTGGWLGLACGLLEDALGGTGGNVLSATLVGFGSGLLANRFFSDSLPVFLAAVAGATAIRAACDYAIFEWVYGERGLFRTATHAFVWTALMNCAVAAVALLALRVRAHARMIG